MAEGQGSTVAANCKDSKKKDIPKSVEKALHSLVQPVPEGLIPVRGYEFSENGVDYHALLQSYRTSGFQATNFGLAVEQILQMVNAKSLLTMQGRLYNFFMTSNYVGGI